MKRETGGAPIQVEFEVRQNKRASFLQKSIREKPFLLCISFYQIFLPKALPKSSIQRILILGSSPNPLKAKERIFPEFPVISGGRRNVILLAILRQISPAASFKKSLIPAF
ncbi:MAG: hypothetical protein AMJ94_19750 [Deltaproteobacteria bacterium SM23_61]|nr:MAG: hypothetical protein AMJ94_19750 [Deltaproteobacteria bacterium SM23_61]